MKISFIKLSQFLLCLSVGFVFLSCDDKEKIEPKPGASACGVFILNQGLDNSNDASISFLDLLTEETNNFVLDIAGGFLGDVGQDMLIYGSKLYVTLSGSHYIKVFDVLSRNSVKTIDVKKEGNNPSAPRSLAAYNGKIYATTTDGYVIKVDTTSYTVEAWTTVGPNPEGIAAVTVNGKGKLYVANSDGYNWENGYVNGKSVSVVDIETFKENDAERIPVGLNPAVLHADSHGNVYVICNGNYYDVMPSFVKIDSKTNKAEIIEAITPYNFTIDGNLCYFYNSPFTGDTSPLGVGIYDIETQKVITDNFISDETILKTPYGIGIDPNTKNVYIGDSPEYTLPGKTYIMSPEGKCLQTLQVGVCPCCFAFYQAINQNKTTFP